MRTADQPIRISLFAPDGRMGQAITSAAADDPGFVIDQDHADVLIDFSAPAALEASLNRAISAGVSILVGTTGLDASADELIAGAARQVAVLRAANTSLGVALLAELVERAAREDHPAFGPVGQDHPFLGAEEEHVMVTRNAAAAQRCEADRTSLALQAGAVATALRIERGSAAARRGLAEQ